MDNLSVLKLEISEYEKTLGLVSKEQWLLPTPCPSWTVYGVINHVVAGNRLFTAVLETKPSFQAINLLVTDTLGDDPLGAFRRYAGELVDRFEQPGVMDRMFQHPMFPRPLSGADLLVRRVSDLALHHWDLARAIGADEKLHPEVVQVAWGLFEPIVDKIPNTGVLGPGPSGQVSDTAPALIRLLDATGRRP